MKIGIISHSPGWTTGFGVTCNKIAKGLSKRGHLVTCLGIGTLKEIAIRVKYNSQIYLVDWENVFNGLSDFLKAEDPDVILINFDIGSVTYLIKLCKYLEWKKKIFAHAVLDGFPVHPNSINILSKIDGTIVPTMASKKYLKKNGIKNIYYAPHGVAKSEFYPIKRKDELKLKLSSEIDLKDSFIVGVFAKNEERKQIPKILLALAILIHQFKENNIFLYLHTQVRPEFDKGCDLGVLVDHLNLNRNVVFTDKMFKQNKGNDICIDKQNSNTDLNYLERINLCDLIVNIPFSGGFELCNIEAQSCGIPLITINDYGNIKEVVGESAMLIQPKMKNVWINGPIVYFVDENDLAKKILLIKGNSKLRQDFIKKGLLNAAKFSWSSLSRTISRMIE